MRAARALRWERRPDDRPQELIDAALRVFAERGYRGTRLEEVAEAAGVTKGTIYHYFDTKEELLLGAIEHYRALAFGRIEEVLGDPALSSADRIRLVVRRTFAGGSGPRRDLLSLLVLGVAHEVPRLYDRWIGEGPARIWGTIAALADEGVRGGEFRSGVDVEVAARILVSGLLLQLIWHGREGASAAMAIDEDRLIDGAVESFLAPLRRAPDDDRPGGVR